MENTSSKFCYWFLDAVTFLVTELFILIIKLRTDSSDDKKVIE